MEIEDFSYMQCLNCKNVITLPIPYEDNRTLLHDMCNYYAKLNECCNDSYNSFGPIKYGIENGIIKLSDLPLALRKEFPLEVTHEFACGKHSLVVTKHNGDKVLVHVDGERIIILDGMTENSIYIGEDKND